VDIRAYIQSGIIEGYVLGLATPAEVAEMETLRLQHREVESAVQQFSVLLEQRAVENAIPPPPGVKERILEAIQEKKDTPALRVVGSREKREVSVPVIRALKFAAAVAVPLLVLSAALNIYLYSKYRDKSIAYQSLLIEKKTLVADNQVYQTRMNEWHSAAAMLADSAMKQVTLKGTKGREDNMVMLLWDTRNRDVYIMPKKLPTPAQGKQFQLWALVDGKPVDAGMLSPGCAAMCKMKNISKAEGFAITLENEGGSPSPTLSEMYVLGTI